MDNNRTRPQPGKRRGRKFSARTGYRGVSATGLQLTPVVDLDDPSKELDWTLKVESNGLWEVDDLEVLFKRDPSDTGCTGTALFNIQLLGDGWEFVEDVDGGTLDGMRACNGSSPLEGIIHTRLTRDKRVLILEVDCMEANTEEMRFDFQWAAKKNGIEYCSADPGLSIPPPDRR